MRNIVMIPFILTFILSLYLNATESTKSSNKPSPSVVKLLNKYNLDVVNYDYINEIIDIKKKKTLIIDARPEKKYFISHIPTAILIPITKWEENIEKLKDVNKNVELITYCGGYGCTKGPQLAAKLKEIGFNNTKVYLGGMPEYSRKNYMVVETPAVLSAYKKNSALLIDARPYKMYIAGTIPGALSISDTKMVSLSGRFPRDKSTPIITFCGGYKCSKSHKLAKKLIKEGYKNVKVYAGGLPNWKKAGCLTTNRKIALPSEVTAKKVLLSSGVVAGLDEGTVDGEWFKSNLNKLASNILIVDVRPESDYETDHLNGCVNIYAEDMSAKNFLAKLPKDKTIVFICASGGRALEAWAKLNDAKFNMSIIFYFDANIECQKSECKIEVNEPLG